MKSHCLENLRFHQPLYKMQGYYYEGKSSKPLFGNPPIIVYIKCKDIVTRENHPSHFKAIAWKIYIFINT